MVKNVKVEKLIEWVFWNCDNCTDSVVTCTETDSNHLCSENGFTVD